MSSKADIFILNTLGEDFFESLQKFELWKPGTRTTLDHEEIHTALRIVPRTIVTLLVRELSVMSIGDSKEIPLPMEMTDSRDGDVKLRVTKHERDVYTGDIVQANKTIVDFKYRSIPGIGLIIMSAFELYDVDDLKKENSHPDIESKVQQLIEERLALHDLINKVVDKKIAEKDAIQQLLLEKVGSQLREAQEELERERIRLAGAGVAAIGYDDGNVHPDYDSASRQDALRLYEEKERLRKELEQSNRSEESVNPKIREQISELNDIARTSAPMDDEYFRGIANGIAVADAVVNDREPNFVESKKKKSPLGDFLEKRKSKKELKKNEFSIQLAKGELVSCPDCGGSIFDGQVFSGCICVGDDMEKKVFLKKTEDGIQVRFSKGWDQENIEMLLEVLRRKNER